MQRYNSENDARNQKETGKKKEEALGPICVEWVVHFCGFWLVKCICPTPRQHPAKVAVNSNKPLSEKSTPAIMTNLCFFLKSS